MPTDMGGMFAFAKPLMDHLKGLEEAYYNFCVENDMNVVEEQALESMLTGELNYQMSKARIKIRLDRMDKKNG